MQATVIPKACIFARLFVITPAAPADVTRRKVFLRACAVFASVLNRDLRNLRERFLSATLPARARLP
jgi:hypothetical protein